MSRKYILFHNIFTTPISCLDSPGHLGDSGQLAPPHFHSTSPPNVLRCNKQRIQWDSLVVIHTPPEVPSLQLARLCDRDTI